MSASEPWSDIATTFLAKEREADELSRGIARRFLSEQPPQHGAQGAQGPQGPQGDVGPVPRHQVDGARIRFEEPDGTWGPWMDLEGPAGAPGARIISGGGPGPQGPQGLPGTGGVSVVASVPTLIAADETFTIQRDTQVLFAEPIEVHGEIYVRGAFRAVS